MALISYADSALSILPPVAAIGLAILTRRVLLSLGLGIVLGIAMLADFSPAVLLSELSARATGLVWEGEGVASWNLYTLGFLMIMGMLMALISVSGGTRAFAHWARRRIRDRRDAQWMTLFLGAVIFIDDYFNALLVGNVARPVTDQYRISREKLAYCIDSTSAPVCVISPISTWGAYIMSLLAALLATHGLNEVTALSLFAQMIPFNLYAVTALALLICVVYFRLDVGPMAEAERRAQAGQPWDEAKGMPAGEDLGLEQVRGGTVLNLAGPLLLLVSLVVGLMLFSGDRALHAMGHAFGLIAALENADGAWSMVTAGSITLVITALGMIAQGVSPVLIGRAAVKGVHSMLPAVYILLMAWTIAGVIADLQTGNYLAGLASDSLPQTLLPALVFLISAAAAFSTGTSYGTFAIMLPIAANMALALEPALLVPALSAVLAGGVFGDHCSPISDTTILSSTGSACHHMDHVATQLPYALVAAALALAGYLVLGFTGSVAAGLLISCLGLMVVVGLLRRREGGMNHYRTEGA
ncbi:Na+/H+ antiporter NhaC family protein [Ferrimonas sediminicola]|uniref:Na+/H+ antiporter NhaC family protein n=1 Tax=Ferrimonas sediminicola TaxID=2569538 RepID=A0A4U1BIL3_9GAMM|nr:Na+/H+ antiporter NhaC family protein [Ferrimonas sediminicola]TKB49886.1 Na+/H+ antiporter NhaC family protein [Ferrimonas sediminicola]